MLDQVKAAAPLLQEIVLLTVIEKVCNEMKMLGLQIEKERRLERIKRDLEQMV